MSGQKKTISHGSAVGHVSHTQQPLCIPHLLATRSEHAPDALAVLAPGRPPLTYGHLRRFVDDTVQALHAMGLGRHNRVALVLPNGPEMAMACLAVASGATCMPLNPSYTAGELNFYLGKLRAQALIIPADMHSPARAVAQARGLQIIELQPKREAEAGLFTFTGVGSLPSGVPAYAQPDDVAFVMHTSGTTSQPKSVPLTHANICSSADHARTALVLEENDRYLNVLPLFHGAALVSGLLTSLMAGASVVCAPDF